MGENVNGRWDDLVRTMSGSKLDSIAGDIEGVVMDMHYKNKSNGSRQEYTEER